MVAKESAYRSGFVAMIYMEPLAWDGPADGASSALRIEHCLVLLRAQAIRVFDLSVVLESATGLCADFFAENWIVAVFVPPSGAIPFLVFGPALQIAG